MKTPKISRTCTSRRYDSLPDYMKPYYNRPIHTSDTLKKPYFCPNGKAKCSMCSHKTKGDQKAKARNLRDRIDSAI